MNRELIDRWNEVVDEGDDVWMLGDFALGKIDDTLPFVGELHGRKVLLAGNHDRCWTEHGRRANGWEQRYLAAGFAEVRQGQVNIDISDVTTLACHFPYPGDSHDLSPLLANIALSALVVLPPRSPLATRPLPRSSGR